MTVLCFMFFFFFFFVFFFVFFFFFFFLGGGGGGAFFLFFMFGHSLISIERRLFMFKCLRNFCESLFFSKTMIQ